MTSEGFEPPVPFPGQAGGQIVDESEWDEPLTRLLLLLEIADRPTWLRDIARPARCEEQWHSRAG